MSNCASARRAAQEKGLPGRGRVDVGPLTAPEAPEGSSTESSVRTWGAVP